MFFYQLFNIIQQQKNCFNFFFFSKFSHERLPSWHQLQPGKSALPGQRTWWGNFGQRQNAIKYIRILFESSLKYHAIKKNWSKIFRITKKVMQKIRWGNCWTEILKFIFKKIELMFENQTQLHCFRLFQCNSIR